MLENYVVLPCNGLDKCAGIVSGQLAVRLSEHADNVIICPVFYRVSGAKYDKLASERPLLVIDGCRTQCASKLAAEKNLKISRKMIIADEAKNRQVELTGNLRLQEKEYALIDALFNDLNKSGDAAITPNGAEEISYDFVYETFQVGKFIFRIPKNKEVYYNENDCWAWIKGNRARVGVTDYVQQNLSDIMYFNPPEIGAEIEQFGAVGEIESSKALVELISPVSGRVTAVNEILVQKPELINENPYELGWIAEIELTNFESDKELLIGYEQYFSITKKRAEATHD